MASSSDDKSSDDRAPEAKAQLPSEVRLFLEKLHKHLVKEPQNSIAISDISSGDSEAVQELHHAWSDCQSHGSVEDILIKAPGVFDIGDSKWGPRLVMLTAAALQQHFLDAAASFVRSQPQGSFRLASLTNDKAGASDEVVTAWKAFQCRCEDAKPKLSEVLRGSSLFEVCNDFSAAGTQNVCLAAVLAETRRKRFCDEVVRFFYPRSCRPKFTVVLPKLVCPSEGVEGNESVCEAWQAVKKRNKCGPRQLKQVLLEHGHLFDLEETKGGTTLVSLSEHALKERLFQESITALEAVSETSIELDKLFKNEPVQKAWQALHHKSKHLKRNRVFEDKPALFILNRDASGVLLVQLKSKSQDNAASSDDLADLPVATASSDFGCFSALVEDAEEENAALDVMGENDGGKGKQQGQEAEPRDERQASSIDQLQEELETFGEADNRQVEKVEERSALQETQLTRAAKEQERDLLHAEFQNLSNAASDGSGSHAACLSPLGLPLPSSDMPPPERTSSTNAPEIDLVEEPSVEEEQEGEILPMEVPNPGTGTSDGNYSHTACLPPPGLALSSHDLPSSVGMCSVDAPGKNLAAQAATSLQVSSLRKSLEASRKECEELRLWKAEKQLTENMQAQKTRLCFLRLHAENKMLQSDKKYLQRQILQLANKHKEDLQVYANMHMQTQAVLTQRFGHDVIASERDGQSRSNIIMGSTSSSGDYDNLTEMPELLLQAGEPDFDAVRLLDPCAMLAEPPAPSQEVVENSASALKQVLSGHSFSESWDVDDELLARMEERESRENRADDMNSLTFGANLGTPSEASLHTDWSRKVAPRMESVKRQLKLQQMLSKRTGKNFTTLTQGITYLDDAEPSQESLQALAMDVSKITGLARCSTKASLMAHMRMVNKQANEAKHQGIAGL